MPLQSNIPPSQIAAKNTSKPKYKIYGSGLPIINLFPLEARSFCSKNLYEKTVIEKESKPIIKKWFWIEIPLLIIKVVKPTPQIPPVLQSPCMEPIILFSNFFCNVMAWVLTAILKIRMVNANRQIAITNVKMELEKPISASATALVAKAKVSGIRLSYLATSQPENGNPTREVSGIASKIVPNSASFKSKNSFIVGMRDAQVAKLKPEMKKKILKKNRW